MAQEGCLLRKEGAGYGVTYLDENLLTAGLIEFSQVMLVHTYQLHLDPTKDLVDLFARFPSPPASTISVLYSHFQCDFASVAGGSGQACFGVGHMT